MTTGQGRLDHDAIEAGQAVHLRHVHVQRDDIRLELFEAGRAPRDRCARTRPRNPGLPREHWPNSLRTRAESSTTRTLITHPPSALCLETYPASPCSARVKSSSGSSSSTIRPARCQIDDAMHQRVTFRPSDRAASSTLSRARAQDIRDAVDDEPGAMPFGLARRPAARPRLCSSCGMSKRRRWSTTGSTSPRRLTTPSRNFGVLGTRVICAGTCATSTTASIGQAELVFAQTKDEENQLFAICRHPVPSWTPIEFADPPSISASHPPETCGRATG